MKHYTESHGHISPQAYGLAERYDLGRPITEYRLIFLRREAVPIVRCVLFLALLVLMIVFLVRNFPGFLSRGDVRELLLALCGGVLFVYWIVDVVGVFRHLQNLSQQRTSLLVCQKGFLYTHDDHREIAHWQQVQHYTLTQPGISRRITIYLTDGRRFQVDDRLGNFGNFLWRLTCQLMTRDLMREDALLSLPKVFRLRPKFRKKHIPLFVGGILIVEGMLWMVSLSDSPLFAQIFGILQFILVWAVFVAIVMLWLRQRLVSKLQIVLSQEGITYDGPNYSIYTPWENIVSVEDISPLALFGLRLRVPARQDMSAKEGREQGIAVLERHWWGLIEKRFRKNFPCTDMFPLDPSLIGSRWLQGELAQYLCTYAPQTCNEKED